MMCVLKNRFLEKRSNKEKTDENQRALPIFYFLYQKSVDIVFCMWYYCLAVKSRGDLSRRKKSVKFIF